MRILSACAAEARAAPPSAGLLLVKLDGSPQWADLEQMDVVPAALRAARRYPHTSFLRLGRCSLPLPPIRPPTVMVARGSHKKEIRKYIKM